MTTSASDSLSKRNQHRVGSLGFGGVDEDVEDLSPLSRAHAELVADGFVWGWRHFAAPLCLGTAP